MKKVFFLITAISIFTLTVNAQDKAFTKTGNISFYSKTSMENIEAHNKKATAILDSKTGQIEFALLMKAFEFEKALMEEHFNENYVESDKFPKSTFKGKIDNLSSVNFSKDGSYPVTVSGDLTIHGVTKPVTSKGAIAISGGKISAKSQFDILLSDYNISIPAVVKENISNNVQIFVELSLEALTQ
ncbi:MAG: YceI family protein [Fimbriimonadaceae bacterium]|nr:YceI family protein [Chitinophagales bacterium]